MPNPVDINCPADQWTKVATAVTDGWIKIKNPVGLKILGSYRTTGATAPSGRDDYTEETIGNRFRIQHSNSEPIDAYIYPIGKAVTVVVSL